MVEGVQQGPVLVGTFFRGDERVCPGEVRDPYPPVVWQVAVEPPDPGVD